MSELTPVGWDRVSVGDVFEFNYGRALKQVDRDESGGYPVYGSNGVVGFHNDFLVEGPALVIGRKGAAGEVSISKSDFWPIDTTYYVKAPEGISITFAYYLLRSLRMVRVEKSTAIPGLNRNDAYALEIPITPTNEQHRIVAKIEELFSELEKGVESLKTAREQLKVYRQSVLKAAFEGRLTESWRKEHEGELESANELLARIKAEREARYEQQLDEWQQTVANWQAAGGKVSGQKKPTKPRKPKELPPLTADELADLPDLPEGWGWIRYGDLCAVVRNGVSAKPEGDSGVKIFRISAVRAMQFDMNDYRYINNESGEFDEYYLHRGDVVFTRYNGTRRYVGVCAVYSSDEKRLFPDKLIQTRLGTNIVLPAFVEKAASSGGSRAFIAQRIRTTAGQSGVSGSDIKAMPVPVCSPQEQRQVVQEIESRFSVVEKMEQSIKESLQKAESLRQSILKRAFEGKLVPQNSNDEPASKLLERIRAERAKVAPTQRRKRKEAA